MYTYIVTVETEEGEEIYRASFQADDAEHAKEQAEDDLCDGERVGQVILTSKDYA